MQKQELKRFRGTLPQRRVPPLVAIPQKKTFPYFLSLVFIGCIWFVWHSVTPVLPKREDPPKLYYHPSREDLRMTLTHAIDRAKESIFISIFGLSDPAMLNALQRAIQRGVSTQIYYDTKGSPNLTKTLKGAKIHPIRHSGIMHHKMIVLDHELVFFGSANFTTHSLKMHDNLVIGVANQKLARFIEEKTPDKTGYLRTQAGGQSMEVWLLPDPKGHVLTDLKHKIKQAKKSLKIALFTLTHPILIEEIIQAKKRNIDTTVVIDLHSALGASAKAIKTLEQAGVPVFYSQGVQLMHHKFLLIDDTTLIAGSANWTRAAFSKNNDSFIILHSLNEEQSNLMKQLWKSLTTLAKKGSKKTSLSI